MPRPPGAASAPHKGGTLTSSTREPQQDFDPARLYTSGGGNVPSLVFRTLTTRNRENGAAGAKVVPDLATDTGRPEQGRHRVDVHPQGGPEVRGRHRDHLRRRQVRHRAVLRAPSSPAARPTCGTGWSAAADYQGPYKDAEGPRLDRDARRQHDRLPSEQARGRVPLPGHRRPSSRRCPKAKDTGTKYEEHPVSSGPYKVVKNENDGEHLTLERNTYWSAKTDAERKAYPDRIDVRSGLDSSVINQRLSASQGADAAAVTTDTNLGPAELAKVSGDKELAARVGTGHFGYTNYLAFNPKVKPFDDPKVRQAISYAIDRSSVVNAAGGSSLAEAATTFLPNQKSFGYQPYDHFPAGDDRRRGQGQGTAEGGRPPERADRHAHPLQQRRTSRPARRSRPRSRTRSRRPASPSSCRAWRTTTTRDTIHDVKTEPGFFLAHWGADWPSGGPFLAPIFDGRQIVKDGANFNTRPPRRQGGQRRDRRDQQADRPRRRPPSAGAHWTRRSASRR